MHGNTKASQGQQDYITARDFSTRGASGLPTCHAHTPPTPCSFGPPPAEIRLESGHRGVAAVAAALTSGSLDLGPGNVADVLQAASYLQVRLWCSWEHVRLRFPSRCADNAGWLWVLPC